jgi:hypothetical protein
MALIHMYTDGVHDPNCMCTRMLFGNTDTIVVPTEHQLVYIAGPMTGIPEQNVPLFRETALRLRGMGYSVITPPMINMNFMGIGHPEIPNPAAPGLRADMIAISLCDSICLLPGWEKSVGASLEVAIAITLSFKFIDYCTGEEIERPEFVVISRGYKK